MLRIFVAFLCSLWIMTLGLAQSVRALPDTASPSVNHSPLASMATPTARPSVRPSSLGAPAPTPEIDASPSIPLRFEDIKRKAETGDPESEYQLGVCYYNGDGVGKDFAKALNWFRKAAEQNYAPAQTYLGFCYANGQGVTKDEVEAVRWYRKATEQNYAPAQTYLGVS